MITKNEVKMIVYQHLNRWLGGRRQLVFVTLNGKLAINSGHYVIYTNPSPGYESFIERFCLRARSGGNISPLKTLHQDAQKCWRTKYSNDSVEFELFMQLKEGEKPFVR